MKDDLESRLRQALRPVEPDSGFVDRLMARIEVLPNSGAGAAPSMTRARRAPATWWLAAGLAACLVAGVGVGVQMHEREQRERAAGLEARRQVLDALRVTDGVVGRAYALVKQQPAAVPNDQPHS